MMTLEPKYLEINGGRVAYYHRGNPEGIPVITFHGGPGSYAKESHFETFDLDVCQVVIFDQRGCGQSTPLGGLVDNNTSNLVADAEKIRQLLGFKKVIVAGGSWGAALALLYAEEFPENTSGIIIKSPYLARQAERDWLFGDEGAARFFPDLWEERQIYLLAQGFPEVSADKIWQRELFHNQETRAKQAAAAIMSWEWNIAELEKEFTRVKPEDVTQENLAHLRVFVHYDQNQYFLKNNQILNHLNKIEHIPLKIVHGRYDFVSPPSASWDLHRNHPLSTLEITDGDGHKLSTRTKIVYKYLFKELIAEINKVKAITLRV